MVYVIANFNFGSRAAPENQMDKFNNEIVEKWNSAIQEDDRVFVFGTIGGKTRKETREVLEKLKGKIYICNCNENDNFTKEEWLSWNIFKVWNTSFYYSPNDEKFYFFLAKETNTKGFLDFKEKLSDIYTITWGENGIDSVYENKHLSIDAKYWDYTPISLREIPNIILRMEEFEKMEDEVNEKENN